MVLIRRNGTAVTIAVRAVRIVRFVEIKYQCIVDDVFDAKVEVTASAVGALAVTHVLERYKKVVAVLGEGVAYTAVDAQLVIYPG